MNVDCDVLSSKKRKINVQLEDPREDENNPTVQALKQIDLDPNMTPEQV